MELWYTNKSPTTLDYFPIPFHRLITFHYKIQLTKKYLALFLCFFIIYYHILSISICQDSVTKKVILFIVSDNEDNNRYFHCPSYFTTPP